METILIEGKNLTAEQIELIPFWGASKMSWVKNHSFYFSKDGKQYTTNTNEYYPVCKSLSHLPY